MRNEKIDPEAYERVWGTPPSEEPGMLQPGPPNVVPIPAAVEADVLEVVNAGIEQVLMAIESLQKSHEDLKARVDALAESIARQTTFRQSTWELHGKDR